MMVCFLPLIAFSFASLLWYNRPIMKKIPLLIITLLIIIGISPSAYADAPDIPAKAAFAVEVSTGKILYDKNAKERLPIASLTKLITIYLVYQEIKEGRLTWETPVPISDYAYSLVTNPDISNPHMLQKDYTVKQLVEASLVASANSASIALAEKIAGSEAAFVDKMIALLNNWGISNILLVNVTGLNNQALPAEKRYPNSAETDENQLSAQDLGLVAYHLLTDFPEILDITKLPKVDFDGTPLASSNKFLPGLEKARAGVDGLKTGTTELAGQTLITTSIENNMRLITVILNADGTTENPFARFDATSQLLTYIGEHYHLETIWEKGKAYHHTSLAVTYGKKASLPVIASDNLTLVRPKDAPTQQPVTIEPLAGLEAPITKGQPLGRAQVTDKHLIGDGYLQPPHHIITLLAKSATQRQPDWAIWWQRFLDALPF